MHAAACAERCRAQSAASRPERCRNSPANHMPPASSTADCALLRGAAAGTAPDSSACLFLGPAGVQASAQGVHAEASGGHVCPMVKYRRTPVAPSRPEPRSPMYTEGQDSVWRPVPNPLAAEEPLQPATENGPRDRPLRAPARSRFPPAHELARYRRALANQGRIAALWRRRGTRGGPTLPASCVRGPCLHLCLPRLDLWANFFE